MTLRVRGAGECDGSCVAVVTDSIEGTAVITLQRVWRVQLQRRRMNASTAIGIGALPLELSLVILKHCHLLDVLALANVSVQWCRICSDYVPEALYRRAWARIQRSQALFDGATRTVMSVASLLSLREVMSFHPHKNSRGVRRMLRRRHGGCWLIPRSMTCVAALRIGSLQHEASRSG